MDIDITDLSQPEIVQVLSNFPRGKLVIKQDRIFWDSPSFEPIARPQGAAGFSPPANPPRGNDIGDRFARMADVLGSMVC